jgi:DNA-binding transcriptional ArsR family regulator
MRALAHPLRLRLCELFAEIPRTTKQAAAILGEPPTRLYHHVHALERAGLVRLRETRQKRGAYEKYYELTPRGKRGHLRASDREATPADWRQAAAVAESVLQVTRQEMAAALSRPGRVLRREKPLVARLVILTPAMASRVRRDLLALVRRYAGKATPDGMKAASEDRGQRWSLTLALLPSEPWRRKRE